MSQDTLPATLGGVAPYTDLARRYASSPPALLIRAAEVALLATLPLPRPRLDLACGDGFIVSLLDAAPWDAGCDLSEPALRAAAARGRYRSLACCDVTRGLPYPDAAFRTILSNSSLEHVRDIDGALREAARVLQPSGRLIFTLASDHAYRWWPLGEAAKQEYLLVQPVYSYFSIEEWTRRLGLVGLEVESHAYYLDRTASRLLFWLDYHFSRAYLRPEPGPAHRLLRATGRLPRPLLARFWSRLFAPLALRVEGEGGGLLVVARKAVTPC